MGIGSLWTTVKQKITAGVAATIIVAGTLVVVNQPGHEAQIGLLNPATGDTLWAVDSADLDWKYDSLVSIGHIVMVPGDYVYAYSKRGDIISSDAKQSLLNGYVIEVIDPADEGWHNSIAAKQKELHRALAPAEMEDMLFPTAGKMRKAYSVIRAKRGSALAAKLKASTVPTDTSTASATYKPKSGFVDYAKLEKALNVPGLKDKANSPDVMDIIDGEKIPANVVSLSGADTGAVIKDPRSQVPEQAHDFNVISKGEYTCGSGGSYATITAAMSDVTTLDSALTLVVISSHTITAVATSTAIATGQMITLSNLTPTSGFVISVNFNTDHGIRFAFNGGTVVIANMSFKRTSAAMGAAFAFMRLGNTTAKTQFRISNVIFDCNSVANSAGIYSATAKAGSYCVNSVCLSVGSSTYGFRSDDSISYENCSVIGGAGGFQRISTGEPVFRNCVSTATIGFDGTASAIGYNNASTDTSCSNVVWATGSGNRVSIVAATEFHSVDPASPLCGRLKKSVLWNGGTTPTYAGATDLAGRARPGQDGGYAIGAYEYHWLSAPGLVGIAPRYASGDSTLNQPYDTAGLAHLWPLNLDTASGVTSDSGNAAARNGTLQNGCYITGANFISGNGSAFFDSADDVINFGDVNEIDGAAALTVSGWARHTGLGKSDVIWSKWTATTNRIFFWVNANSALQFYVDLAVDYTATTPSSVIVPGVWYHFALTIDLGATGDTGKVKIYINGAKQTLTYAGTAEATLPTYDSAFVVGQTIAAAASKMKGNIDGLHMFSRMLSDVEVQTMAVADSGRAKSRRRNDTTTTGLLLVDTVGLGSNGADTIAFAVGDTTTWRKFKVEADKVYDVAQYLTNNASNTVYARALNTMGASGVTAYSVHAAMPLGGNGSPLRMGIGIFLSQLYKGVRHELAQVSSEISARVSGSILVRLRRERRPVCESGFDLRAEGHIPHARLHGNERM